jgi:D-glycero-D-manno-heptose 1,7-bisphosphate phosphatase
VALIDHVGIWCEVGSGDFAGRPALFLDRDGVVVEDVDFLSRAEDIRVTAGAAPAIACCNRLGLPVVLVTNQSGIGRGYYDWTAFHAVQAAISAVLAGAGARFNAVLACAYHADAQGPFRVADHPWRKPRPGMILEAVRRMGLDPGRSWIIGDRASDLEAGRAAALAGGVLVLTRHGIRERDIASRHASNDYAVEISPDLPEAVARLIARGRLQVWTN